MAKSISRNAVRRLIDTRSVVVVEALGAEFFGDGHLPLAVNLPLLSPDSEMQAIVGALSFPIVVYGSRTGGEARELAQRLEALGVSDVRIYDGGKEDWVEAGLPVERR